MGMKPSPFWLRLQARDRPETLVSTAPKDRKALSTPSRSTAHTTVDAVRETLASRDIDERREQDAADAIKLTPRRGLMAAAMAGSKVAIAQLAKAELVRRGRRVSREATRRLVGDVATTTAEGIADTGDQADEL